MFGKFCKVLLAGSTPFVFWDVPFENMYKLGWVGQYLGEMVGGHKLEHSWRSQVGLGWRSQVGLGWTVLRGNGWGRLCGCRHLLVFISPNTFWWLFWGFDRGCGLGSRTLYTLLCWVRSSILVRLFPCPLAPSGVHLV